MSASVWNPGATVPVASGSGVMSETIAMTAAQTVVPISSFTYTIASRALYVYLNGVLLLVGLDYVETSTSYITLLAPSTVGDEITLIGILGLTQIVVGASLTPEVVIPSALTTQIGSAASQFINITGSNTISSLGNVYKGPLFLRFSAALTLVNSSALQITGGADLVTEVGTMVVATPKATAGVSDGWMVSVFGGGGGGAGTILASSVIYIPPDGMPAATTVQERLAFIDGTSPIATNQDGSDGGYGQAPGANVNIKRDAYLVTGGTFGHVNSAIVARTRSGTTEDAFEWTALFAMDNYCSTSAQNVAVYAKANRYGTSPVFAGCFEFRDYTGSANPPSGCIGMEVDIFANGTDSNFQRVGVDVTSGKGIAGAACVVGHGIRVGGAAADTSYINGITIGAGAGGDAGAGTDLMTRALAISTTGTYAIWTKGTYSVGIDLSNSSHSASAIRFKHGDGISWGPTDNCKLIYDGTNAYFAVGGVPKFGLLAAGDYFATGCFAGFSAGNNYTTATAGAAGALPANPVGYFRIVIDGFTFKFPYYN